MALPRNRRRLTWFRVLATPSNIRENAGGVVGAPSLQLGPIGSSRQPQLDGMSAREGTLGRFALLLDGCGSNVCRQRECQCGDVGRLEIECAEREPAQGADQNGGEGRGGAAMPA